MEEYPTLQFHYLPMNDITRLRMIIDEVIKSFDNLNHDPDDWYRNLLNRYILVSHEENKNFFICKTMEYWEDDIRKCSNPNISDMYTNLKEFLKHKTCHGRNVLSEFVIEHDVTIMSKIIYNILFMMTDVFKTNQMIVEVQRHEHDESSFPQLLHHAISSNFVDVKIISDESKKYIIIREGDFK